MIGRARTAAVSAAAVASAAAALTSRRRSRRTSRRRSRPLRDARTQLSCQRDEATERAREVGALRVKLLVAEEASRHACADAASTRAELDAADAYSFFVMKAVGFGVFKAVLEPIAGPPMRRGSSPASLGLRESTLLPSRISPFLLSFHPHLSSFIFFLSPKISLSPTFLFLSPKAFFSS